MTTEKTEFRHLLLLLAIYLVGTPAVHAEPSWTDRIAFSGDTRLRFESIDAEGSPDRERSRIRARFGFSAEVNDDVEFILRLATGDGSPVSTNVTLDSGFSAKDILLDRAYVNWRLNDAWNVRGGKMSSPWFKPGGTPLVWDSDLNPEGAAALFNHDNFFGSLAALSVEERSSADDSLLLTAQGGWQGNVTDRGKLTAGVSYFAYTNTVGNAPFYDGNANGNTVDVNGDYLSDYRLVEVFAEFKTKVNDVPLTLYADLVQNTEASVEDTAYAIGANIGKASDPGTLQFGYAWHDTEADAVIGTFNDSDFAGGDTDAKGHFIKARYALRNNVALGGTLIIAERGEFAGNERDYNRLMLDLEFKFK